MAMSWRRRCCWIWTPRSLATPLSAASTRLSIWPPPRAISRSNNLSLFLVMFFFIWLLLKHLFLSLDAQIVQLLLKNGACVDSRNYCGQVVLFNFINWVIVSWKKNWRLEFCRRRWCRRVGTGTGRWSRLLCCTDATWVSVFSSYN